MKAEHTKDASDQRFSTILVYLVAVLYIGFGIAFLTLPQLRAEQFCYLLAGGLILLGILKVGEYFIRECYKNVNQYGFSIGVFVIILGICVIIRIQQFAEIFNLCLGIGILLTAIIKVQNAMDLRALEDRAFAVFLGLAVVLVICAAVILVDPFSNVETRNHFTYLVLIADGILSLISTTYLIIRTRGQKQPSGSNAGQKQTLNEADGWTQTPEQDFLTKQTSYEEPAKTSSDGDSEGEKEDEQP